ncbi:MAG TPA: protein kinase [Gemmatimonadaceae bacterium]|nr:protein kinase [Gemmatimonadaceae bacterium]
MSDALRERVVGAVGELYELGDEVGRGGMSVVYRALDRRLQRTVALKVLPPELAYDPAIRTRFTREAQTSAQLGHAHIVPIFDVGERGGLAYLVMAHVAGGSLGALLAREPRLPVDTARRLIREVADALAYAHLRGVIHRDVKPDNILIDAESGRALVTDFGIARAMEVGTRLTVTGIAVGTPTYMSPEQAVGEREIDGRSDIYSLGVVAYQMLTGRVPFRAGNSMALLMKHVTEPPRPIADLRPDVPRELSDAIERALEKSPEDRWPSASALRDALAEDGTPAVAWRSVKREDARKQKADRSPPRGGPASSRGWNEAGANGRWDEARAGAPPHGKSRAAEFRSPLPSAAAEPRSAQLPARVDSPPRIVLEPDHLVTLTPEQRKDLRLWHGQINLLERVRMFRRYVPATLVMIFAGIGAFAFGIEEEIPPLVFAPIVPLYMMRKLYLRGGSLRAAGLKLRRVLLSPRARWALPSPSPQPTMDDLLKLAPREVLDGPHGAAVRRAAEERAAVLHIVEKLPKADRALLPEVTPTVNALVERIAVLAQMLHRLDQSLDPRALRQLEERIAEVEHESDTAEGQRRLALLNRQRTTLEELIQRRATLARQLDSAGLALGNLRLDLIKLRSSGLQSAMSDVSTATQEARALSRDIGAALDAADEVRAI